MSALTQPWQDCTFIAFDTETTGQYPLTAEICEIAAVKWHRGQVVAEFQTLLKPSALMDDFVISIHHITNEMVASAPLMADKIGEFHAFIADGILIAHHAPFDLGFLSIEFEKARLDPPPHPVICSSLLARAVITESPDHRLQTLVSHLKLPVRQAHRALEDAKSCLDLALHTMHRIGPGVSLAEVFARQGEPLRWDRYSIEALCKSAVGLAVVNAIKAKAHLEIVYKQKNARQILPIGLVRNALGDYLVAREYNEEHAKRFYLDKISSARIIY